MIAAERALMACLAISGIWVLYFTIFVAIGLMARRAFGAKGASFLDTLTCFWIGFGVAIAFLEVWQLFLPVSWICLAVLAAIAFWGNCGPAARGDLRSLFQAQNRDAGLVCFLAVVMFWVADRSTGPMLLFDSAMYHIPVVQWFTHYAIVPGLGNIQDRLAFNNSSLLYCALLDSALWPKQSQHLAIGLPAVVGLAQIGFAANRLRTHPGRLEASSLFDLVLVVPVVSIIVSEEISSLSTDSLAALVVFVASSMYYRTVSEPAQSAGERQWRYFAVFLLAALALTIKASAIVFSVALCILVLIACLRDSHWHYPGVSRTGLALLGIPVFLVAVWTLRGICLSGYPFYPSTFGKLRVPWRVPEALAEAQRLWIIGSARYDATVSPGWAWVRNWTRFELNWPVRTVSNMDRAILAILAPAALTLFANIIGIVQFAVARKSAKRAAAQWTLALPCLAGIVFWVFTAPAPRFGYYLFWVLCALSVAQALRSTPPLAQRRMIISGLVTLTAVSVLFPIRQSWLRGPVSFAEGIADRLLIVPVPDHGLAPLPRVSLTQVTTDFGLRLFTPVSSRLCYDAPLPCTQHPATNLKEVRLFDGRPMFEAVGGWRQTNFPNEQVEYRRGETPRFVYLDDPGKSSAVGPGFQTRQ